MVTATPVPRFLAKLAGQIWPDDPQAQSAFTTALQTPQRLSPGILWCRERPEPLPFPVLAPYPWQPAWVDRLPPDTQPGRHAYHAQGYYYCLDISSVFAGAVLGAIPIPNPVVIDVCAAPGGKALLAWRYLQPQVLLVNETIGKRVGMLVSNLRRCRVPGVVLRQDSQVLAQYLAQSAAVVVVDAPCSGQSLLAKGDKNPGCFHPVTIGKNANRQRRILANAAQLVKPGGYLAYLTCTYSPAENEENCRWLLGKFPQFQAVAVSDLAAAQSHLADFPCYRLWPQSGAGAGAFTCLLRDCTEGTGAEIPWAWLAQTAVARPDGR
ncbi:Fmu (Sun) domain-containing protein [Gloeomargarita lithophora Alchichica-D10]|uniref:Fmu (Sun) domain-containing protein n=1 Tax=Gloeomargarita lithophora Alchichica-D10 TaxID=1188229 RepID=A0A1J0AGW5_9CYAN|nr:RsmB/NOP family class I SAM-dependent RNA methyltransferase [Gloeomargarita lithophora]APB35188.1 Fmu (Sun) domain-containing protein [Gloeomargarita lithophora Alchichica-D10]